MHRRHFAQLLGSALIIPVWGCRPGEPDPLAIARYLGLDPAEQPWLEALSPQAQSELRAALERPGGSDTERAVELTFSLLGTRSRTYAFVGYPAVNDRRAACDGLLAE
jgi:hypothetical protein